MKYEDENEIENVAWGDVTKNQIGIIGGNQAEFIKSIYKFLKTIIKNNI